MNTHQIKKLMERKPFAHKGESGHVLIIGGSEDYSGAVTLAGIAALRAGCDMVTIAAPEKVAWAVNCYSPDLITQKLKGKIITSKHIKALMPLIRKCDVIIVGNGLGLNTKTKLFCKNLMQLAKNKLKVIDADAIKLLRLQEMNNAIITPHAQELKILLHNSQLSLSKDQKKIHELQKHVHTNVLLIKGPTDTLISKNKSIKIKSGNPGMAKAGTGDVLAGLCAGFLAQTKDLFKSAEAASVINKKLGDLLLKKKGYSFIASDLIEEMKRLKNQ